MIPDFPHSIKIRLAHYFFLLCPDVTKSAKLRQPTWQRLCIVRTKEKKSNGDNFISILWGKSAIIKFDFKTTYFGFLVSDLMYIPWTVNNTSVHKYWKILFYPPNTDTGTFYRGYTDIDTNAQYPKLNTDILVLLVF